MALKSTEIETLVNLGLTPVQARLYLALVKFGSSKTLQLSELSKIARPQIYRSLSKLENLGLVERLIEKPVRYRATSLEKGLTLLLETKEKQFKKTRAETHALIKRTKISEINTQKEIPRFILIPHGRTIIDRINTSINKANLSINLVLSWKRFSQGIASIFSESMEHAWARKVKVRFIIEKPLENRTVNQMVEYCRKNSCCQLRFIPKYPNTVFGIYDKKELFVIVFSKTDLPSSPALWSNNNSLIALATDYFECLWNKATESLH